MAITFKDFIRDELDYRDFRDDYEYSSLSQRSKRFLKAFDATAAQGRVREAFTENLPTDFYTATEVQKRTVTRERTVDINMTELAYSKLVETVEQLDNLDHENRSLRKQISEHKIKQRQEETLRSQVPSVKLAWERYQLLLKTVG